MAQQGNEPHGEALAHASTLPPQDTPSPADAPASDDTLSAGSAPDPSMPFQAARRLDRYIILGELGKGGMGVVYAAYDPGLDRRVALKLMRPGRGYRAETRKRFLREGQALAKVSHPNVVHVYELGLYGEHIFVAMELIEGQSLHQWCTAEPRPSWQDILAAYLAAAAGLEAAHAAGIVHRDVKPTNILMGKNGRVRVADFGLAAVMRGSLAPGDSERVIEASTAANKSEHTPPTASPEPGGAPHERLTQTGAILGTPYYMAPEQHLGAELSPATDQYSFCVSLYEGLYGALPFESTKSGRAVHQLLEQKLSGELVPPPAGTPGTPIPAWVHKALVRGLAPKPEDRYASMHALIATLEYDPRARARDRLRRLALAGMSAVLAAVAVFGWMHTREPAQGSVCSALGRELDGIWDPVLKKRVREAFLATNLSYAPDTAERVLVALDDYAGSWLEMRTEVCHAPQGNNVATLRYLCLERRKSQLGALAEIFSHGADAEVVAEAMQAARSLPPIDYCADTAALVARVPPPEDPAMRERVNRLQPRVARLQALRDAGKYREGVQQGNALLAELDEHDYAPLVAEVLYWTANLQERAGDYGEAETQARQSIRIAAKGKDDLLEARAWVLLLGVVGSKQKRFNKTEPIMEWIQTAVDRADDEETRAYASSNLGNVLQTMGRYQQATDEHRRALAIREQTLGSEHPDVAASLNNLGNLLQTMGRYPEAKDAHERALAIRERTLGSEHPDVGMSLNNLGNVLQNMGKYQEAKAAYERALALRQKALGSEHPYVATSLGNLGRVLQNMGEYDEAMRAYEGAVIIRQNALGSEHPDVAISLSNLGRVLQDMGRYEEAASAHQRTLVIWEKSLGDAHPYVASALVGLGRASIGQGKLNAAARYLGRALTIRENALGSTHPDLAHVLLGLGELALARRQPGRAAAVLERAMRLGNADLQPAIELALAQALWSQVTEDKTRAMIMAQRARDTYAARTNLTELARADAWIAEHRPR